MSSEDSAPAAVTVSEEDVACAEAFKEQANVEFKAKKFKAAIELYSRAIAINATAVYLSNRAMAELKVEEYGAVIEDATQALKLDPTFIKAYHRRANG